MFQGKRCESRRNVERVAAESKFESQPCATTVLPFVLHHVILFSIESCGGSNSRPKNWIVVNVDKLDHISPTLKTLVSCTLRPLVSKFLHIDEGIAPPQKKKPYDSVGYTTWIISFSCCRMAATMNLCVGRPSDAKDDVNLSREAVWSLCLLPS